MKNRRLTFAILIVVGVALVVLTKFGIFSKSTNPSTIEVADEANPPTSEPVQENMAEPMRASEQVAKSVDGEIAEEQKMFQLILVDMADCLDLKANENSDPPPVSIESIISNVQTELGPATIQGDRWMNWHMKTPEGQEKRIRLEINEDEEGKKFKDLRYFSVDKEGVPTPLEIPAENAANPTDDVINQMLKEGVVFYKEKAGYVVFAGGEHIEYIEKNGVLGEAEFQKGDRFYRCQNFKSRESCQCVR